jgi:hypothetical protein
LGKLSVGSIPTPGTNKNIRLTWPHAPPTTPASNHVSTATRSRETHNLHDQLIPDCRSFPNPVPGYGSSLADPPAAGSIVLPNVCVEGQTKKRRLVLDLMR